MPMNQGKVMVALADGADPELVGAFNWTFELDADLAVPEADFPADQSLGVWSWRYDATQGKGIVRVYQRVSARYPWICTYFGADVGEGVKANMAYDGQYGTRTLHTPLPDRALDEAIKINRAATLLGGGCC